MTSTAIPSRSTIQRRAMRMLALLSKRRDQGRGPIPAIDIAPRIGVPLGMSHETKRRRVREAAVEARKMLRGNYVALTASGEGYALTAGRVELRAYISRRKRAGLAHLAEAGRVDRSPAKSAATGQTMLFDK